MMPWQWKECSILNLLHVVGSRSKGVCDELALRCNIKRNHILYDDLTHPRCRCCKHPGVHKESDMARKGEEHRVEGIRKTLWERTPTRTHTKTRTAQDTFRVCEILKPKDFKKGRDVRTFAFHPLAFLSSSSCSYNYMRRLIPVDLCPSFRHMYATNA